MKKSILTILIIHFSLLTANAQWEIINNQITDPVSSFASYGNILYAAVGGDGIYKTTNTGINWSLLNNGINTQQYNAIAVKDSIMFIASDQGLFRTTDYGNTWDSLHTIQGSALCVIIVDNFVYVGMLNGIHRSTNWGNDWVNINEGLPFHKTCISLTFYNSIIFAGIYDLPYLKIFKSTNYGENLIYISQDIQSNGSPYSLFAHENLILCGTAWGVYKSTNGGTNWGLIPGIPANIGLFGFTSVGTKYIFISAWEHGVFVSNDSGQTFSQRNEGLQSICCTALFRFNDFLFLSTNWFPAIYRRPVIEVIRIRKISSEIPESYKLYQNYPNPFNSHTIIKFQIKDSRFVALKIHDVSGKEITTLVSEKKSAGIYEVNFDAGNLSSGIYFCSLYSDGKIIDTKKLILVK